MDFAWSHAFERATAAYLVFEATTPDLMGTFHAAQATTKPFPGGPPGDPEQQVQQLRAWLDSDSLDWDAVERGDAWTD